jgi:hypothetical protein
MCGGGAKVKLYSFFTLGARWGCLSTPRPDRLTPVTRPGIHCIGGWVGPRADLEGTGQSRSLRYSIPGPHNP